MIHRKYLILFLGIITVGLFALSPAIYAAIEPHITIMMDPGQTTNPFQIKDDSNNDIFTIDTDGHVTPEHEIRGFNHDSVSETGITCLVEEITTSTHECVLKYWELSYLNDDVIDSYPVIVTHSHGQSMEARWVVNGGACIYGFQYSQDDGAFWNFWDGGFTSVNSATFDVATDWDAEDGMYDINALRVIVYTNTAGNECEFRNLMGDGALHIPSWMTVTKIR